MWGPADPRLISKSAIFWKPLKFYYAQSSPSHLKVLESGLIYTIFFLIYKTKRFVYIKVYNKKKINRIKDR